MLFAIKLSVRTRTRGIAMKDKFAEEVFFIRNGKKEFFDKFSYIRMKYGQVEKALNYRL